jgi:two-component system, LuxR family, sensor kinase FixL
VNPARPHPGGSRDPLGIVAGTAAQEIGSALTAIQVAAERLERSSIGAGAPGSPELRVIREQSRRLARLARNLLELARPPESHSVPVDLVREVRRLLPPLGRVLAREGVELRVEGLVEGGATPGPRVQADPARIQEILLALVANARKAVASAPAPRWIRVSVHATPDGRAEVRVADSGPGVPKEAEERIFLPFVSGWGGEGMGLSRSRLSLAGQGGGLRLSQDDQGRTEFILMLEPFFEEAK